ncbi:TonB-dependent receptor [Methylopila musalis]|uniref:TonB-dependent receptor n=1 Tax=Methylopila musalis TaxID=1134781 RepID=A0ABW3Z362_9HYPH
MRRHVRASVLFGVSLTALVTATTAPAQEAEQDGEIALDEIAVFGRKRIEDPQRAPVSISVLGGASVPSLSSDPGADITRDTPNLSFGSVGMTGQDFLNMRGVGPLGLPLNSLDNTVGVAVDGVPTTAYGYPPSLLDVRQVEVLRGPQGTTFGRNALGGMVNVVTNEADGTPTFRVTGEVGSDGHRLAEAVAGGWIVPDRVAGRIAARASGIDGDVPNRIVGGKEGEAKIGAVRGSLRFTPGDDLTVTFGGSYDEDKRTGGFSLLLEHPKYPASGSDIIPWSERRRGDLSLKVEKRFEAFTVTSTTSFQDMRLRSRYDYSDTFLMDLISPIPIQGFWTNPDADKVDTREHEKVFNQEIRFNSAEDSWLTWVVGGAYFRSDYNQKRVARTYSPYANGDFDTDIVSDTWAGFADVTVPVTDRLKISGGLRLAHDRQNFRTDYMPAVDGAPFRQRDRISDTYLTGRAAVSYDWTDNWMTYASVAHGYASGGFEKATISSPLYQQNEPFKPSTGWTYEIGSKSEFLDGKAKLNASLFYNDVSDGQIISYLIDGGALQYFFANQNYDSYGFELEGSAQLSERFTVRGGLGVTESELKNVKKTPTTTYKNGNEVPNTPNVTVTLGAQYVLPGVAIGLPGDVFARADYQYVGKRAADVANSFDLKAYHLVNARLGWTIDKFQVYGFANNLLDKRPQLFGATYAANAHAMAVGRGRVIGLGSTYAW